MFTFDKKSYYMNLQRTLTYIITFVIDIHLKLNKAIDISTIYINLKFFCNYVASLIRIIHIIGK